MKWLIVTFILIHGQWQQHIADPAHCPECAITPVGSFDTREKCEQFIRNLGGPDMPESYSGPGGRYRPVGGGFELKLSQPERNGLSAMRVLCVQMGDQ